PRRSHVDCRLPEKGDGVPILLWILEFAVYGLYAGLDDGLKLAQIADEHDQARLAQRRFNDTRFFFARVTADLASPSRRFGALLDQFIDNLAAQAVEFAHRN